MSKRLHIIQDGPGNSATATRSTGTSSTQTLGVGMEPVEQPLVALPAYIPFVRPQHYTVKLPYNFQYCFGHTGTGVPQVMTMRLNSIFDPNLAYIAGSGQHQPNGRDDACRDYTHYRVLATDWSISCKGIAGNFSLMNIAVGIADADVFPTTAATNYESFREIPGFSTQRLNLQAGSDQIVKWSGRYDPNFNRDFIRLEPGVTSNLTSAVTTGGWTTIGSDPDMSDYLLTLYAPAPKTTTIGINTYESCPNSFIWEVYMEYTVQFRSNQMNNSDVNQD